MPGYRFSIIPSYSERRSIRGERDADLSQTAKDYIEKNCGGVYEYLTAHIEAEVRKQKIPSSAAESVMKQLQEAGIDSFIKEI